MDLESERTGERVFPAHRQDFDLGWVDGGKLGIGELEIIGVEAQTVGEGAGVSHPDVRVRSVFDFAGADEFLVSGGEDVVHVFARHEGGGTQRHVKLVIGPVVVAYGLPPPMRYANSHQRSHSRRIQIVEGGVNMPAKESGEVDILGFRDGMFVELAVMGMFESDVLQAFILGKKAVADDLHLRLMRDGFQVWMQHATFGIESFAVAVGVSARVEALREFKLGFGR